MGRKKVKCPYCGYVMPLQYEMLAVANGIFVRCKGKKCKKVFEIKIEAGEQVK